MTRKTLYLILIFLILPIPGYVFVDKSVFMLEKDNKFCIACHLHEKKYEDFNGPEAEFMTLSSKHHAEKIRCIDCHKGEGIVERGMVLMVAGIDTIEYFLRLHEEPKEMGFPLSNATCIKCHKDDIIPKRSSSDEYHNLTPHLNLNIKCTKCHNAHINGDSKLDFLIEDKVLAICKECHHKILKL